MKYLKTYENLYNIMEKELINFLESFLSNYDDIYVKRAISKNKFFLKVNEFHSKHIFTIKDVDYYPGDEHRYFEINFDSEIKKVDYLEPSILNAVLFIEDVVKNYNQNSNMIKVSDVKNIIDEINPENLELYIDANKYNL